MAGLLNEGFDNRLGPTPEWAWTGILGGQFLLMAASPIVAVSLLLGRSAAAVTAVVVGAIAITFLLVLV